MNNFISKAKAAINPKSWLQRAQWAIHQVAQLKPHYKSPYDENRFQNEKYKIFTWLYIRFWVDGLLFRTIHYCFLFTCVFFLNFLILKTFHFYTDPNFQIGRYFLIDTMKTVGVNNTLYISIWNKNLWPYFAFFAFWALNSIIWIETRKKSFNSLEVNNPEQTFSFLFPKRSILVEKMVNFRIFLWDAAKAMIVLSIIRRFIVFVVTHFSRIHLIKIIERHDRGYYIPMRGYRKMRFSREFFDINFHFHFRYGHIKNKIQNKKWHPMNFFLNRNFGAMEILKRYDKNNKNFRGVFRNLMANKFRKIAAKNLIDFSFLYRPITYKNLFAVKHRFSRKRLWDKRRRWWQTPEFWYELQMKPVFWLKRKWNQIRFIKYYIVTGIHFKPFFTHSSTLTNSVLGFWLLALVLNENLLILAFVLNKIGQFMLTIYKWFVYLTKQNKRENSELDTHSEFLEAPEEDFSNWRLQSMQYTLYYKFDPKQGSAKQIDENKTVRAWDSDDLNHKGNKTPYWTAYEAYLRKRYFERNEGVFINRQRSLLSIYEIRNYRAKYEWFPRIERRSIPTLMAFEYDENAFLVLLTKYKLQLTRPYRVFIHFFKTTRPIYDTIGAKFQRFVNKYIFETKSFKDIYSNMQILIEMVEFRRFQSYEPKATYDKNGEYDEAYEEYLKYAGETFIKMPQNEKILLKKTKRRLKFSIKILHGKLFNTPKNKRKYSINFIMTENIVFLKYFVRLLKIFYYLNKIINFPFQKSNVLTSQVKRVNQIYTKMATIILYPIVNWPKSTDRIKNWFNMIKTHFLVIGTKIILKAEYKLIYFSKKNISQISVKPKSRNFKRSSLIRHLIWMKKKIEQSPSFVENIAQEMETNTIVFEDNKIIQKSATQFIKYSEKIDDEINIIINALIRFIKKIWDITKTITLLAIILITYAAIYYAFLNFEDPIVVVPWYKHLGRGIFYAFSIIGIFVQITLMVLLVKKTPFGFAINDLKRADILLLTITSLAITIFSILKLKRIVDQHLVAHILNNGSKQDYMIRWTLEKKSKKSISRFNRKRFHSLKSRLYPNYPEPSFNPNYSVMHTDQPRVTINGWYEHSSQHDVFFRTTWWMDAPPKYSDQHRLLSIGPKYAVPHYMPAEELTTVTSEQQLEKIKTSIGSKYLLEYYTNPKNVDRKYEGLAIEPWYDYRKDPHYDPNKDPFFYSYNVIPPRELKATEVPVNKSIENTYKPIEIEKT